MISFASQADFDEITALWQVSFGDTQDYIRFFLDRCFTQNACLTYRRGDRLLGMLFLLPCQLNHLEGRYIYAACTHPDARRQGIMGRLLESAKQRMAAGAFSFLCLVPADEQLFDYYGKFGFVPYFRHARIRRPAVDLQELQLEALSAGAFLERRKRWLEGLPLPVLEWPESFLRYAYEENGNNGGAVHAAGADGYLFYRENAGLGEVLEWAGQDYCVQKLNFPAKCTTIDLRYPDFGVEHGRYNGMICTDSVALRKLERPFLSLYLD